MAAKKIKTILKLQIEAGAATPAPPVGPALGQAGVNIMSLFNNIMQKQQIKEVKLFLLLLLFTKIELSLL